MQDIEIFPDDEIIEKFIEEAIQLVKDEQKQRSKFLEHLVPKKARQLLQAFNCFEFI
jgi:hypothetical protein